MAKKLREEKDRIEAENHALRRELAAASNERVRLDEKVQSLMSERDVIQLKVEAMLDAMTMIDSEVAEAIGR